MAARPTRLGGAGVSRIRRPLGPPSDTDRLDCPFSAFRQFAYPTYSWPIPIIDVVAQLLYGLLEKAQLPVDLGPHEPLARTPMSSGTSYWASTAATTAAADSAD
jgi:hypothetical protein